MAGFIILKFFLQYILISPEYDLQRDEYLYLDQGNNLAFGYLSVPPVTSWISFIIKLLGDSVFWIKFFPAFFGAMTLLVVWKTIEELKGNLFALILGATCVLFSVLLRLNTLYQPNSLDVLCWTTFYFVVIKYINTEKQKWLFVGAVVFAVGFLNKYNIAFLVLGIFPAILVTTQRRLLINTRLLMPIVLGIVLILPNMIWQYNNQFPVYYHMKELSETQLVNVNRWDFLKSQLLFFTGSLFVIISALFAFLFYAPYKKYMPFFWAIFFTLIIFIYFRAKDYYAIGLYPIYIAFGSVYLAEILRSGWKKHLQPIAIAIPVLLFIPMYYYVFPNRSPEYIVKNENKYKALGLLRWEDGKDHQIPQDFADMLGWKELAQKVDRIYAGVPHPDRTLVLCDNYGQAGAINYYTRQGITAASFSADYINWFNLDKQCTNLIRIKGAGAREEELKETSPHFDTSLIADSVTNKYAREFGTTIFLFIGAKTDINKKIADEIYEVKHNR